MRRLVLALLLTVSAPAAAQAPAARIVPDVSPPVAALRAPVFEPGARHRPLSLERQPLVSTPRLGRSIDDPGPVCRSACAATYYRCTAQQDEAAPCGGQWSRCLTACSNLVTNR